MPLHDALGQGCSEGMWCDWGLEQVSLAAIRLLESYQVRQGPPRPMLESLEGLTRLGGIPQVLLYSQYLARFQGSRDLLLPVLPNPQISPPEKAFHPFLASTPESSVSLGTAGRNGS